MIFSIKNETEPATTPAFFRNGISTGPSKDHSLFLKAEADMRLEGS